MTVSAALPDWVNENSFFPVCIAREEGGAWELYDNTVDPNRYPIRVYLNTRGEGRVYDFTPAWGGFRETFSVERMNEIMEGFRVGQLVVQASEQVHGEQ